MRKCPFLTFVFGLFSGIAIGMLIAPKSGEETRKIITDKTNDTAKDLRKKVDEVYYDINGVKDTIKDTITLYTGSSIQEVEGETVFEKEFDV